MLLSSPLQRTQDIKHLLLITWTLKKADKNRIEAFEMWVYRRLLRVSWTEHRPNVSVLQEIGPRSTLLNRINRMYLQYLGL